MAPDNRGGPSRLPQGLLVKQREIRRGEEEGPAETRAMRPQAKDGQGRPGPAEAGGEIWKGNASPANRHLDLPHGASRTVREHLSVVLSHNICGHLLQPP